MSLTSAHPGASETPASAPVDSAPDQATGLAALWRSVLPTEAEIRAARRRLHLKAVFIAALVTASYWALVVADSSLLLRFASAAVLVTGLIATATSIMHDANHGAFSRSQRLDRVVSYVADGLGTSSFMWRFKHNVLHHGATNVEGIDSDIDQPPFARLSPGQPWRRWHRYQHIYLWPLYGFMALKNLLIGDLRNVVTGRIGPQEMRHRPAPVPLRSGVVVIAQREPRRTRVGIRLTSTDESSSPIWPSANDVHLDPHRDDDPCWRCDEAAAAHAATAADAARS